ncbi:MAG: cytochrome c oxidase, subunit [Myxococcales bacterium]|nr:cytochrome c oxidase, subunit [Myxococcales bacterium]
MNQAAVVAGEAGWELPSRNRVGMVCFIVAESAMFVIFVVAYLFYLGKSPYGPTPEQALSLPVANTICLLSSSGTIAWAVRALRRGRLATFAVAWGATAALGALFLAGTGREWARLVHHERLTPATNLFGTTYYSLVGLHAFHVTVGLVLLTTVLMLTLFGKLHRRYTEHVEVLALYWHFVDCVWIVVFSVVYVIGR